MTAEDRAPTASLDALAREVHVARERVQSRRHELAGHTGHVAFADAQRDLWQALEAYVGALEARGLPVPRRVLSELHLHRELCAPRRR